MASTGGSYNHAETATDDSGAAANRLQQVPEVEELYAALEDYAVPVNDAPGPHVNPAAAQPNGIPLHAQSNVMSAHAQPNVNPVQPLPVVNQVQPAKNTVSMGVAIPFYFSTTRGVTHAISILSFFALLVCSAYVYDNIGTRYRIDTSLGYYHYDASDASVSYPLAVAVIGFILEVTEVVMSIMRISQKISINQKAVRAVASLYHFGLAVMVFAAAILYNGAIGISAVTAYDAFAMVAIGSLSVRIHLDTIWWMMGPAMEFTRWPLLGAHKRPSTTNN